MLLIGAILALNGLTVSAISANLWLQLTFYLTLVSGITAFILGVFGTVGLLLKRSFDEDLRNYTAPIDYFNLIGHSSHFPDRFAFLDAGGHAI